MALLIDTIWLITCRHLPSHGSREVVVVFGSLTTCDPGNIHDTIDALVKDRYAGIKVYIRGLRDLGVG